MFKRAVHPGEILKGELEELEITAAEFARQIDVPPNRVSQIIAGKRAITGDTALRFGHWFEIDPQFGLTFRASTILPLRTRKRAARSGTFLRGRARRRAMVRASGRLPALLAEPKVA